MSRKPLLIEIGVEEIPAGVSVALGGALLAKIEELLLDNGLTPENLVRHVSPRRLLIHASACATCEPDRDEVMWGPPEKVAFADGKPTKAAEGFASKSGLSVDDFSLEEKGDGKTRYMKAVVHRQGRKTADILAEALPEILRKLPSPKQMRWQDGSTRDDAFIRPIRWLVARIGNDAIPFEFAGVKSGKESRGHRIHGDVGELDVDDPLGWLEQRRVMASREQRIARIEEKTREVCEAAGVEAVADAGLVEEVADLTEWPVPLIAGFQHDFLRLPEEVIRITLKSHQRCFITRDASGAISNKFVAVANIGSKEPAKVAEGNARVVNARLSDAAFYFDRDPSESLDDRVEKLNNVTYQEGLGMVSDQVRRMRSFVLDNARHIGADADAAQRAAYLCKSDLTTGLVYEFPELQGYMGGIYARMQNEPARVADAIAEHYQPAGADDALPATPEARIIAIAERIDKLLGYFHLGKIPTASADPYGLRRAAIGLIRLLADTAVPVEMTLHKVIHEAARQWNQQRVTIAVSDETRQQVYDFIVERLMGMASHFGLSRASIDAAIAAETERPLCQHLEVATLLMGFADSEAGQAVAAANKRIANILKKAGSEGGEVDATRFAEEAERTLFEALARAETKIDFANPEKALEQLAALREPVDRFFDDVMVMAEDKKVRDNRLALLARLRALFLNLADVSRL